MSLQNELASIRKKEFKPVYTLLGKETHLINRFKTCLKEEVIEEGNDEFNVLSFDMTETLLDDVLNEAETMPFFGDKKILFIENPYFLTAENKKSGVEQNLKLLETYLKNPLESAILVFIINNEKMDERKKIVKLLKKESNIVDCGQLKDKQLIEYVKQYIENENYSIDKGALDQLLYLTDTNLSQIINELQKLFIFKGEEKKITKSDVTDLIPKTLEHNIFDLTQNVLTNKYNQSISLYHDLLLSGEETIKIVSILIGQARLLLQVKLLLDKTYQQSNISDMLKIHPYRVKLAVQQVREMRKNDIGNMFNELVDLDYAIKTGQIDKELGLELFLLKTR